jgi:hypothetical protein
LNKKCSIEVIGYLFSVIRKATTDMPEVVSKPSIGFKVKADWDSQPQEYREYFEDWMSQSNTEIEVEGRF